MEEKNLKNIYEKEEGVNVFFYKKDGVILPYGEYAYSLDEDEKWRPISEKDGTQEVFRYVDVKTFPLIDEINSINSEVGEDGEYILEIYFINNDSKEDRCIFFAKGQIDITDKTISFTTKYNETEKYNKKSIFNIVADPSLPLLKKTHSQLRNYFKDEASWVAPVDERLVVKVENMEKSNLISLLGKNGVQCSDDLTIGELKKMAIVNLYIDPKGKITLNDFRGVGENFVKKHFLTSFDDKNNVVLDTLIGKSKEQIGGHDPSYITGDQTNTSQLIAIKKAHENIVTNIQGPPGTGKTTLLKDLISSIYLNDKTTIVLSTNNKAVDNVINALLKDEKYKNLPILRLGNNDHMLTLYSKLLVDSAELSDVDNKPIDDVELFDATNNILDLQRGVIDKLNYESSEDFLKWMSSKESFTDIEQADYFCKEVETLIKSIEDYIFWLDKHKDRKRYWLIFSVEKKKKKIIKEVNKTISTISEESQKTIQMITGEKSIYELLDIIADYKNKFETINKLVKDNDEVILFNEIMAEEMDKRNADTWIDPNEDLKESILSNKNNTVILKQKTDKNQREIIEIKRKLKEDIDKIAELIIKKHNSGKKEQKTDDPEKIKAKIFGGFLKNQDLNEEMEWAKWLSPGYAEYKALRVKYYKKFYKLHPIIFTTTGSTYALPEFLKTFRRIDYGIIDEAAQTKMLETLALTRYINKLVLLGDTKQLPAVVSIDKNKEDVLAKECELPTFWRNRENSIPKVLETLLPKENHHLLNEHWRCSPDIALFFNRKYYDSSLILRAEKYEGDKVFGHLNNPYGADTASDMNMHIYRNNCEQGLEDLIEAYEKDWKNLAIITPHSDDAALIKEKYKDIASGTVHKFQGYENDHVIYWMGTHTEPSSMLIDNPRLINVAISRAKKTLTLALSEEQYDKIKLNSNHETSKLIDWINEDKEVDRNELVKLNTLVKWMEGKEIPKEDLPSSGYAKLDGDAYEYVVNNDLKIGLKLHKAIISSSIGSDNAPIQPNISIGVRCVDVNKAWTTDFHSTYDVVVFDKRAKVLGIFKETTTGLNPKYKMVYVDSEWNIDWDTREIDDTVEAKNIMSDREIQFYNLMCSVKTSTMAKVNGNDVDVNETEKIRVILPTIALNRVINVDGKEYFGQITNDEKHFTAKKMHFDFSFGTLDKETGNIKIEFLLELDDSSHSLEDAKKRDEIKDMISRVAGFDLIRVKTYFG